MTTERELMVTKPADYFAPLDEKRIIGYEPDPEPICAACRKGRHEYCISKRGFECWCEEDEHGLH